jgi:hypothetical protein
MPDVDDPAQLATDVASALDEYAILYREAVRIAADGISLSELEDWTRACWETALDIWLIETDEVHYAAGAPRSIDTLVRELYESATILSGVERVAHILSLPLSTCANGETLAPLVGPGSEFATWCATVTGTPYTAPEIPPSLIRHNPDQSLPLAFNYAERAADADRNEAADKQIDLGDVFAVRLSESIAAYDESVASVRSAAAGAHATVTAAARRAAPALLGFARIAATGDADLYAPDEAPAVARLVADGFVTLAAAQTAEDVATLPYPDAGAVSAAAAPLAGWFGDHGVG